LILKNHGAVGQAGAGHDRRPSVVSNESRHGQDPVERTRVVIKFLLVDQRASLTRAASCMQMRTRELKGVLRRKGLNFSDLRDKVRYQMAVDYLARSDAHIAEVGMLVGFSEESSFFRAFKRWSGETPGAYRRRAKTLESTSG
jgi:AraC-like DNA-binding protein